MATGGSGATAPSNRNHIDENIEIGDNNVTLKELLNKINTINTEITNINKKFRNEQDLPFMRVRPNGNITMSKSYTYSGEEVPFNTVCDYNNTDFLYNSNGRIYARKPCAVLVSTIIATSLADGYILIGGKNGGYATFIGASNVTSLAGNTYAGTCIQLLEAGDYITCKLGRSGTYSNVTVYADSTISAVVIKSL